MNSILFVELLGGVGDLVIALPAIHALALSHPQARVAVLTFAPGAELLAADPLVAQVYHAVRGDAAQPDRPRRALEALLAGEPFDLIVSDTTYSGIDALLEGSGARVVSNLWRSSPPGRLIELRFLDILAEEGLIAPWACALQGRLALDAGDRLWAAAQLPADRRRALLHPHVGMPIKRWPLERFVALGRALHDELGLEIVVSAGVGAEAAQARELVAALGPGATLLAPGTLRQFAAAAAHAGLVVGADTGPVRLAGAVGALTITLFGPSWHGRYGLRPPNVNLQGYPQCPERHVPDFTRQRCWYAGQCPLGHRPSCLEDIAVGDVIEAAQRLLEKTAWWGKPLAGN
ncbi:MAG TPA: glycosyltransferase family 9 protein [Anaerolineae bacterium]|nr:glycosyltransferase family 9 protein [Anaerolineae bacterium]HOR00216.1 glycosyltransferase family 9 protein [Anaerolineae bacterium]HPL28269.1 glycosyltransferase family 9 protein [Anaerolineae bacterium]